MDFDALRKKIEEELKEYKSTLAQTSLDKANNKSLCNWQKEVYNFDSYMKRFHRGKKSFDALCIVFYRI